MRRAARGVGSSQSNCCQKEFIVRATLFGRRVAPAIDCTCPPPDYPRGCDRLFKFEFIPSADELHRANIIIQSVAHKLNGSQSRFFIFVSNLTTTTKPKPQLPGVRDVHCTPALNPLKQLGTCANHIFTISFTVTPTKRSFSKLFVQFNRLRTTELQ